MVARACAPDALRPHDVLRGEGRGFCLAGFFFFFEATSAPCRDLPEDEDLAADGFREAPLSPREG